VSLAKLFVLMLLAGGAGGVLGSIVGSGLGRGGLIAGGVIGGAAFVAAAAFLATARGWITPQQRPWTIAGGEAGFGAACLVALSTLSSPLGPVAGTLLIGAGAVIGAIVGSSPHASRSGHADPES